MRRTLGLLTASALLLVVLVVPAAADQKPIAASGTFTSTLKFSSLELAPVGEACLLTVEGQLDFDGTLEGIANAKTTALIFATCDEVDEAPPGTFADVFASDLHFKGIVSEGTMSTPATADINWFGRSRPGGQIDSVMAVNGDNVKGRLRVEATVGVGGTYQGKLKVR